MRANPKDPEEPDCTATHYVEFRRVTTDEPVAILLDDIREFESVNGGMTILTLVNHSSVRTIAVRTPYEHVRELMNDYFIFVAPRSPSAPKVQRLSVKRTNPPEPLVEVERKSEQNPEKDS